jgi:hypothetical protein
VNWSKIEIRIQEELLIIHKIGSIPMNGYISDKPDCLPDGSGYPGTHNYPSYIRSCIDIDKQTQDLDVWWKL